MGHRFETCKRICLFRTWDNPVTWTGISNWAEPRTTDATTNKGKMDFAIPEKTQKLLAELDAFIEDVIKPIEQEDDNIRFLITGRGQSNRLGP